MKNILFYKYQDLKNIEELREKILKYCENNKIKGKIILAKEGINGCVSLEDEKTEKFTNFIENIFKEIEFKITPTYVHDFKRIFVKIKKEIITSNFDIGDEKPAPYIEPEQLEKLIDNDEIILLDARNTYESKTGKFKNALTPDIDTFSQFPDGIKNLSHLKEKKIVTYCTGGIRCEKASAYLKTQGFKNVFQLKGGIINYGNKVGDKNWEGLCIVFDHRRAIEIDPKRHRKIDVCKWCALPENKTMKCDTCNEKYTCCKECYIEKNKKCGKICLNAQKPLLSN